MKKSISLSLILLVYLLLLCNSCVSRRKYTASVYEVRELENTIDELENTIDRLKREKNELEDQIETLEDIIERAKRQLRYDNTYGAMRILNEN